MAKRGNTEIQRTIVSMAGSLSPFEIFMDWIRCGALMIANTTQREHDQVWQDRERLYISTISKYPEEDRKKFADMMAWLYKELDDEPRDVLGEIFMDGMGSEAGGQFFTPFDLSILMADIATDWQNDTGIYTLNEPSCGSGGGIIAGALALHKKGVNFQRYLRVVAQDLDWNCVYMCYVQLSFMGISAIVVQGNILTEPYEEGYPEERIFRTPKSRGALFREVIF